MTEREKLQVHIEKKRGEALQKALQKAYGEHFKPYKENDQ